MYLWNKGPWLEVPSIKSISKCITGVLIIRKAKKYKDLFNIKRAREVISQ